MTCIDWLAVTGRTSCSTPSGRRGRNCSAWCRRAHCASAPPRTPTAASCCATWCCRTSATTRWPFLRSGPHVGLDALVFIGGIGEHQPAFRAEAASGLGFLGVTLDESRNTGGRDISAPGAPVRTLVSEARKDIEIACRARAVLGGPGTAPGDLVITAQPHDILTSSPGKSI